MAESRVIQCPTCGKKGEWLAGAYGPFCSRRCKLVDLGKWLGEEHAIGSPLPDEADLEEISRKKGGDDEQP